MKHIDFDDSLVLREFVRIAQEKGMIKEAAPADADAAIPMTPEERLESVLRSVPGFVFDKGDTWGSAYNRAFGLARSLKAADQLPRALELDILKVRSLASDLIDKPTAPVQPSQSSVPDAAPSAHYEITRLLRRAEDRFRRDVGKTGAFGSQGLPPNISGKNLSNMVKAYLGAKKDLEEDVRRSLEEALRRYDEAIKMIENMKKELLKGGKRAPTGISKGATEQIEAFKRDLRGFGGVYAVTADSYAGSDTTGLARRVLQIPSARNNPEIRQLIYRYTGKRVAEKKRDFKIAKNEVYDVMDETGKNLVDKAHPGGGTRTELTHSKVEGDGNLVETIVEQQEADVDVANSVPKGTYAALVGLYHGLEKAGQNESAARVGLVINRLSGHGFEHVLVALADKLDSDGFESVANRVDSLVARAEEGDFFSKKQVAYGKAYLGFLLKVLKANIAAAGFGGKALWVWLLRQLPRVWAAFKNETVEVAVGMVADILSHPELVKRIPTLDAGAIMQEAAAAAAAKVPLSEPTEEPQEIEVDTAAVGPAVDEALKSEEVDRDLGVGEGTSGTAQRFQAAHNAWVKRINTRFGPTLPYLDTTGKWDAHTNETILDVVGGDKSKLRNWPVELKGWAQRKIKLINQTKAMKAKEPTTVDLGPANERKAQSMRAGLLQKCLSDPDLKAIISKHNPDAQKELRRRVSNLIGSYNYLKLKSVHENPQICIDELKHAFKKYSG